MSGIVYLPHLGASVALQSGTVGGNTSGASTFFGSNVVLAGGSNVTLQASSDTIYIHGASGGTATGGGGGAGTDWAITGGSITVNTSGGTISLPAYLTTAAPPGAYLTTAAQSDHSHGALSLVNLTGTSASNGLTLSAAAPGGGAAVMVSAGTTSGNVQTLRFQDSNGVSFGLNGSTVTASHNGYTGATTDFLTTSPRLDEIRNPTADAVFAMNTRQVQFQWGTNWTTWTTAPARVGLFELDVGGNYTGTDHVDVLHIHQSVSNPFLHMIHVEANGTNATGIHLEISGPVGIEMNRPISYDGGTVPMILGTSQSNVVSNLNAFYLEGARSSQFLTTAANSTHTHSQYAGTVTGITGSIGLTANTSGVSVSIPAFLTTAQPPGAYLTTARASNDAVGLATAATSVTWTVNSAGISLNAGAYLTTAANSTHSHGNPTLALTNLTGTTASASNGLTISLSAAAPGAGGGIALAATNTTYTSGTVVLSVTGALSMATNGQTVSIGYANNDVEGVSLVGNVAGASTVNQNGNSLYLSGGPNITLSGNGSTVVVSAAAPGGGAGVTLSRWDPCSFVTGSAFSSHAPATWFFQHLENDEDRALSYMNVVKSFNVGIPAGTSSNTSQTFRWSYSHGFTVFSRQNYGTGSTNLTTCCTGSWGMSASFQHSSSNSQSLDLRWVTDSTGGTSNFGTNSAGNGWSARMVGPRLIRIPYVTTLPAGEYWIAHAHSSTAASTGGTANTLLSVSNFHVAPQVLNSNLMLMGIGTTSSSIGHLWPGAQGVASAVTTNNTMPMSVISNLTVNNWYWNAGII